jgi:hypothetical protein
MRQYTWDEYYEKFFDWAESTRARNLYGLVSLGDPEEVGEVIMELHDNGLASDRLLRMAVEAKLVFSEYYLSEFSEKNDVSLVRAAVLNSAESLTSDDMESLYGVIDVDLIEEICKRRGIPLPEDMREYCEDDDLSSEQIGEQASNRHGCLWGLLGILFAPTQSRYTELPLSQGGTQTQSMHASHNVRCNGDCAHCPPHYGYRYGRWYYGHDHVHGCEFGGNKGSGSRD